MIIRRKHTANFTTIGNALLNDERLEADELGVMAFLLSRPNDWEVRRPALARRFRIGRDSIKRILLNSIRLGWIVARKTRLSNGTFHVIYEVRDAPGPELTLEEAKAATSLVSSDAGDGDSDGEPEAEAHPPDPGWEIHPPDTPQPEAASQLRQTRRGSFKEELLNTDSIKTDPPNGGRAFAEVQALWPSAHIVSAFACEQLHVALTEALQDDAFNGVKPYLADCEASNRKVCDLKTYYAERRWERFLRIKPNPQIAVIKPVGPNFERWREYRVKTGDAEGVRAMDLMQKLGRDITVPSPWPPALGSQAPPSSSAA